MLNNDPVKPLKIEPDYERLLQIAALGSFIFGFVAFPLSVMLFVPIGKSFAEMISSFGPLFGMMLLVMMVRFFAGSWHKALEILGIRELTCGIGLAIPLIAFVTIIVSGSITMQWQQFAQNELHVVFDTPATVEMTMKSSLLQTVMLTFSALLAAPIFEEILFRRVLYNFCVTRLRLGVVVSMIATSFVFAAMHMTLLQLPGLFAMAMLWQYIYLKERNLTITILLHFCNNLAAMGMLLLARFLNLPID